MAKRINGKNFDMLSNVKSAYKHIYPQDKDVKYIKDDITFANVLAEMQKGNDFYDITFTDQYSDSLMRERIFTKTVSRKPTALVVGVCQNLIKGKRRGLR